MITLTLIWNDCNCDGLSDHHWHTMEFSETLKELRVLGNWEVWCRIVTDFYIKRADETSESIAEAVELTKCALFDIGLVGIFIGTPEEL